MSKRGEDLIPETLRRIEDDERAFDGFKEKADHVLNVNRPLEEIAQEVMDIINDK